MSCTILLIVLIGSNSKISFKISSVNVIVGFAIFLQEDMEQRKDLRKDFQRSREQVTKKD